MMLGSLPGQLMIGGYGNLGIALSSQPVAVVRTAQRHVKIIREIDPKLDDAAYVRTLTSKVPRKPKLKWCYVHLDFGLSDERAGFFGVPRHRLDAGAVQELRGATKISAAAAARHS